MDTDLKYKKSLQEANKLREILDLLQQDRDKLYSITNKEEALDLVNKNGVFLNSLSLEFKDDSDVVIAAIKNYSHSFAYASDRLKNDREIVLLALEDEGENLEYVSPELKQDKTILLKALEQSLNAFKSIPEDIKQYLEPSNPVKSLKSLILNEKLEDSIPNKNTKTSQHKI